MSVPGTKLRVMDERKTGCDLVDPAVAFEQNDGDPNRIVQNLCSFSGAMFEQCVHEKRRDPQFASEIGVFLTNGYAWDFEGEAVKVRSALIDRLPGEPWQGE